jgi:glycosyltransferase involved in cell wall biosynthesis
VKIAYLNPGGTVGGAEMVLLDVLAMLRSSLPEARPTVVLGDDGPLRAQVEALGVPCEVLPLPGGVARLGDAGGHRLKLLMRGAGSAASALAYGARLARRLRDLRPDLIQTNGMKMHLLGAWTAPRGVPVVWHMHDYLASRPAMARLLRISARPGVEIVAVSHSVAEDVRATLPGRVPVRAIYNGVDVDRFHPGPGIGAALDRAAGLPEATAGTVRVGLVATFATWKGHEVFLDAASRLDAALPARFYVVGGPIYRSAGSQVSLDDLKGRAEALGLTGRVGFTGHQADPSEALRSLDVVVHASTRPEPFGRVIVEGMACGRAVVAMSEGGAAELFVEGDSALGCPPRDPSALAERMARLIADPGLRDRLGRAGRAAVLDRFDRAGLADSWASVYDRSLSAQRSHPPETPADARPFPVER